MDLFNYHARQIKRLQEAWKDIIPEDIIKKHYIHMRDGKVALNVFVDSVNMEYFRNREIKKGKDIVDYTCDIHNRIEGAPLAFFERLRAESEGMYRSFH